MTEITKLKIKLKDREIELTAAEARELHAELGRLFNNADLKDIRDAIERLRMERLTLPHPWQQPIVIEEPKWPVHHPWKIWCCGNDTTLQIQLGGER